MGSHVAPTVFSEVRVHKAIASHADQELYLLRQTIRRLGITSEMIREINGDLDR